MRWLVSGVCVLRVTGAVNADGGVLDEKSRAWSAELSTSFCLTFASSSRLELVIPDGFAARWRDLGSSSGLRQRLRLPSMARSREKVVPPAACPCPLASDGGSSPRGSGAIAEVP